MTDDEKDDRPTSPVRSKVAIGRLVHDDEGQILMFPDGFEIRGTTVQLSKMGSGVLLEVVDDVNDDTTR